MRTSSNCLASRSTILGLPESAAGDLDPVPRLLACSRTTVQPGLVDRLDNGDEFSLDGGHTWHVCSVVLFGTVSVYTRVQDARPTRRDPARRISACRRAAVAPDDVRLIASSYRPAPPRSWRACSGPADATSLCFDHLYPSPDKEIPNEPCDPPTVAALYAAAGIEPGTSTLDAADHLASLAAKIRRLAAVGDPPTLATPG